MAWGNFILDIGTDAAAACTKFYAVKYSAAETVTPVTANTDLVAGFTQYGVTAAEILQGKGASIRVMGVTEAVAASAISVGAVVTLESDGRVSTYVSASGKRVVGKCVGAAATNAGDRIALLVNVNGPLAITGLF